MSQSSKFFQKDDSSDPEEQETQPKSKFFQGKDSSSEEDQAPAKSKFFANNDDDSDDPEYDDKDKGKGKKGDDEPKQSKFFAGNDESSSEEENDKKKSKFFGAGGDDSEDNEDEGDKPTKSKFFAGGDDSEEEEDDKAKASGKGDSKAKQTQAKKGKKGGKKKGKKGKGKDESESEDDKAEVTETKKEEPEAKEEPEEDEIDIDAIDFDGPKKKSRNQKKKEKFKAKKEGGEETKEEGTEGKPAEKKPKAEEKKPKVEEKPKEEAKPKEEKPKAEEAKKDDGKKDKKEDKKGKKPTAAALKAQEMLKKKQEAEEALRAQQAELERIALEEQRREEEEERKRKEEEDRRKKEKEERIKKAKEEGTYKTKKEREKEALAQAAREQFLQSGMIRGPVEEGGEKKSRAVASKKKRPPQKKPEDAESTQTATTEDSEVKAEEKVEPVTKAEETQQQGAGEDVEEDWMSLATEPKKDAKKEPEVKVSKKDEKKEEVSTEQTKDKKSKDKPEEKAPEERKKNSGKGKDKKGARTTTDQEESKEEPVLRSPICCIMGHVDTGKTKLLDKMRNTNVQEGEAGGITQQIGATYFPKKKLDEEVQKITAHYNFKMNVPGLLVIDTPGHESFSNLRSRGSGLCDIVILVIDIMHGIQRQTLEAIELVKMRKTPYVIALNKIDRLYGWKSEKNASSYVSLQKQNRDVKLEFEDRVKKIITTLNENSLNVALYYDNPNVDEYASIIPTSAITGEGIPDLLGVVIRLTQRWLKKKIQLKDEFKCSVLEVKTIEGLGPTIDCILVNGTLREGDRIVLNTFKGPVSTTIRALLTPAPMKEMRVKSEYEHHKEIKAAMGIKIAADDIGEAVAGSDMYLVEKPEDQEHYMTILKDEIQEIKKKINTTSEGVCVAASTLGSLEALLQFLKTSKIPVSNICIGPVSKEEVIRAMKPLLTEDKKVKKEYATILAFDVKVLSDAQAYADSVGVKIMTANIIYHLFDQFIAYLKEIKEKKKQEEGKAAVFPCIIKPVAFFNKKDPIIMGIDVVEGVLKVGTPLVVLDKDKLKIGTVESIERDHKSIQQARPADGSVAIRLSGDTSITCGRHFELKDRLASLISRESIDACKEHFRDDLSKSDWDLVRKLKPFFGIL